MRVDERVALLQALVLFEGQKPEDIAAFLDLADWVELQAGAVLYEEGTEGSDIWLVVEGRVAGTLGEGGNMVVLAEMPPGDLVGIIALYRKRALRPAQVTAVEPCTLVRFDTSTVAILASGGSTIATALEDAVIHALTSRVRDCNSVIADALTPRKGGFSRALRRLRGILGG